MKPHQRHILKVSFKINLSKFVKVTNNPQKVLLKLRSPDSLNSGHSAKD